MANLSLQEQLLKAGLVKQGQARAVKTEKHKQVKQQRNTKDSPDNELKQQIQSKQALQAAKDLELNRIQQQQEESKQLAAKIKQIIKQNCLPLPSPLTAADDSICAYRFTDNDKVKTLYVSPEIQRQLAEGSLGIVKQVESYKVVPAEIARKINSLDSSRLMVLIDESITGIKEDDAYAGYQVPDDLIW
jgi:uncharacterized protein YaiL (DUF2058 family)